MRGIRGKDRNLDDPSKTVDPTLVLANQATRFAYLLGRKTLSVEDRRVVRAIPFFGGLSWEICTNPLHDRCDRAETDGDVERCWWGAIRASSPLLDEDTGAAEAKAVFGEDVAAIVSSPLRRYRSRQVSWRIGDRARRLDDRRRPTADGPTGGLTEGEMANDVP